MAKRELSSTLKNLKFMQRTAKKDELTKKEDEVVAYGNFPSFGFTKKCVVIMEGDPSPGAVRGRMSFRSFNPSIDKLNQEGANPSQPDGSATCSGNQGGRVSNRDNGSAQDEDGTLKGGSSSSDTNGDLKRKQADVGLAAQFPNKSQKSVQGNQGSSSSNGESRGFHKQPKREKLDWNVLRPSKSQSQKRS